MATLLGLMDRLSAPDLTAAEALDLRPQLLSLLDAIEPLRTDPLAPPASARDRTVARGNHRRVVV